MNPSLPAGSRGMGGPPGHSGEERGPYRNTQGLILGAADTGPLQVSGHGCQLPNNHLVSPSF